MPHGFCETGLQVSAVQTNRYEQKLHYRAMHPLQCPTGAERSEGFLGALILVCGKDWN